MKKIWYLLLLLPLLAGCGNVPINIEHYTPVAASAQQEVFMRGEYPYIQYSDKDYWVSATLAGAQSVYVVSLKVVNKTNTDLKPEDYSVYLADGRDAKPLSIISREAVIGYRAHLAGNGEMLKSGSPMADIALAQLNKVVSSLGETQKSELLQSIDSAIEHYFAFRPIYAGEAREGVLCYYPNFVLEYPLTLKLKLRDKAIDLKFWPAPAKQP